MNRIVCEVCGSHDLVKHGELFVCSHCRANYSTEAVKQMVAGVVVIDRTNEIDNLLALAHAALNASNPGEAYDYANRALEIDSQNVDAWVTKGRAAGWSSTLKHFRVTEMLSAFSMAVDLGGAERQETLRRECADQMNRVAVAVHSMSWKHLNKFPGVSGVWQEHITRCNSFVNVWNVSHRWSGAREPLDSIIFVVSNLIKGIKFRGARNENRVVFLQPAYEAQMRQLLETTATKLRSFDPAYIAPNPKRQKAGWL
jgi:hypothetical protein